VVWGTGLVDHGTRQAFSAGKGKPIKMELLQLPIGSTLIPDAYLGGASRKPFTSPWDRWPSAGSDFSHLWLVFSLATDATRVPNNVVTLVRDGWQILPAGIAATQLTPVGRQQLSIAGQLHQHLQHLHQPIGRCSVDTFSIHVFKDRVYVRRAPWSPRW
jgi:hypothetical protein